MTADRSQPTAFERYIYCGDEIGWKQLGQCTRRDLQSAQAAALAPTKDWPACPGVPFFEDGI